MKIFATLLLVLALLQSCDSGTGSNGDRSILEFTWTTDTISDPTRQFPISLQNIAVASPTDVYAAGRSPNPGLTLWHYNGSEWKVPPFSSRNGGAILGAFHVQTVFAFAADDIWAGGRGGIYSEPDWVRVMHYDGSQWLEVLIEPRVESVSGIEQIWGPGSTDVWFTGTNGLIFHWDGNSVRRDTLKPTPASDVWRITIGGNQFGETYSAGSEVVDYVRNQYLMQLVDGNWNLLNTSHDYLITKLWLSPEGTLFGGGEGFLRWNGGGWDQQVDPYHFSANHFSGIADDDILISSSNDGMIWYNGSEITNVETAHSSNTLMKGVWYNGKEAFVVAEQFGDMYSVVFHGK